MRLSGAGQPAKLRRRKSGSLKSSKETVAAAPGRTPAVAELQEQLNALTHELNEARGFWSEVQRFMKTVFGRLCQAL